MRFLWLDGLRGIAAGYVVAFHFFEGSSKFASFGWLAVDLFFVLSGFVLCNTITQASANGLSGLKTFVKKRFLRLYPVLIFALLLTLLTKLAEYSFELYRGTVGDQPAFHSNELILYILSFLLLQFLYPMAITVLVPLWSLSTELYSNLLQIILHLTGSHRRFSLGVLLGVLLVINSGVYFDVNLDWTDYNTWLFGFGRALIGFNIGQIIWKFSGKFTRFNWRHSFFFSIIGFVISVNAWVFAKDFILAPVYICFGFLVLTLSKFKNPNTTSSVYFCLKNLGETSYPIYLFHTIFLGYASVFFTTFRTFNSFIIFYSFNLIFSMIVVKCVEPKIKVLINKFLRVH